MTSCHGSLFLDNEGLMRKRAILVLIVSAIISLTYECEIVSAQKPDLSGLSQEERQSIESACAYDKNINGPAAYNRCLQTQLNMLSGIGIWLQLCQ